METVNKAIHAFKEGDIFDNRYRLVKRAGSGGFADVWKAEDTLRKNKVVALKIYTRLDDDGIKAMSDEYDETEDIQHPNLLTGNHFAAMGNIPYLEMRFCDGGNLSNRAGQMSDEELRHVLHDIASGLAYLHQEGIVHQDIKPENILLDTKHDRYMLADFGISGKSRSRLSRSVNMSNMTLSMTEAYAPPEKFSGNLADIEPDTKGDIFSLGMTMYELTVGQLPFQIPMATGREMLLQRGQLRLDYSKIGNQAIRRIVERCMSYRKEDRPTAEGILEMLDGKDSEQKKQPQEKPSTIKVKVDGGGQKKPEPPQPPKPSKAQSHPQPNRKWIYVAIVVVTALLAVLVLNNKRTNNDSTPESTEMNDFDVQQGKWTGPIEDGKPTGKGILVYKDNDKDGRAKYDGNMQQGLREDDEAVLTYKNGNTYTGSFVNDQFGNGRLTLKNDGLYFQGDFKKDKPYNGTWYWEDGTVYSKVVNGVEKEV